MAPDPAGSGLNGPTEAEVVAIGDELLLGDTVDTNGAWLSRRLSAEGLVVRRRTVVGDDEDAIRSAVSQALARTRTVLCCGGLGPTPDDRTRPVVAGLYGWPLDIDESWVAVMQARFEARGMRMPESNRVQAGVPRGATIFANDFGTAPGLALDHPDLGLTVLLPGVPRELKWLVEAHVIPYLLARLPASRGPVLRRILRTTGLAESAVAERVAGIADDIGPLTLAFLPVGIGIDLRITSWGELPEAQARTAMAALEARLRERLGRALYATDEADLAAIVGAELRARGLTLAVAESCTGGLLSARLTDEAGASDFFQLGVTVYADAAKRDLLGVSRQELAAHGAVSEAVARALVEGVRRLGGTDCGLSITGIAGPGGGTPDKPVGTVWIGAAVRDRAHVKQLRLFGDRTQIRARAAQAALKLLLDMIVDTDV